MRITCVVSLKHCCHHPLSRAKNSMNSPGTTEGGPRSPWSELLLHPACYCHVSNGVNIYMAMAMDHKQTSKKCVGEHLKKTLVWSFVGWCQLHWRFSSPLVVPLITMNPYGKSAWAVPVQHILMVAHVQSFMCTYIYVYICIMCMNTQYACWHVSAESYVCEQCTAHDCPCIIKVHAFIVKLVGQRLGACWRFGGFAVTMVWLPHVPTTSQQKEGSQGREVVNRVGGGVVAAGSRSDEIPVVNFVAMPQGDPVTHGKITAWILPTGVLLRTFWEPQEAWKPVYAYIIDIDI